MKPTTYIKWDRSWKTFHFLLRYKGRWRKQGFGHLLPGRWCCMTTTIADTTFTLPLLLFSKIRNITADWVNLHNLLILRDCARELQSRHRSGRPYFRREFRWQEPRYTHTAYQETLWLFCKRIKELYTQQFNTSLGEGRACCGCQTLNNPLD